MNITSRDYQPNFDIVKERAETIMGVYNATSIHDIFGSENFDEEKI